MAGQGMRPSARAVRPSIRERLVFLGEGRKGSEQGSKAGHGMRPSAQGDGR